MAIITVGYNQVGQFDSWYDEGNEETRRFSFEFSPPFQKFTLSVALSALCTAYYYRYEDGNEQRWAYPCIYSSVGNKPYAKLTKNEQVMDISCPNAAARGWVSAAMEVDGTIPAGTVIWFGLWSDWVSPRYSTGGQPVLYYNLETEVYAGIERFPPEPVLRDDFYTHDIGSVRLSLYFTYSDAPPPAVYTRKTVAVAGIADVRMCRRAVRRFAPESVGAREGAAARRRMCRGCAESCAAAESRGVRRVLAVWAAGIVGVREACAVSFLFLAAVRVVAGMRSGAVHRRILERLIAGFAGIWERFLWRKPLNRIEVRLFSPVCTQIIVRSKL